MAKIDTARETRHVYVCGNSGTGKSASIKERIKKAPRVIVFDPDDEYSALSGFKRVTRPADLVDLLARNPKRALKVAFVAEGEKHFALWCKCVFAWANCVAVAEEIADVTSPAKAPPAWGRLIRRGRKYGIEIWAVTQRPPRPIKPFYLTRRCCEPARWGAWLTERPLPPKWIFPWGKLERSCHWILSNITAPI